MISVHDREWRPIGHPGGLNLYSCAEHNGFASTDILHSTLMYVLILRAEKHFSEAIVRHVPIVSPELHPMSPQSSLALYR
jgi:hypothetical protein